MCSLYMKQVLIGPQSTLCQFLYYISDITRLATTIKNLMGETKFVDNQKQGQQIIIMFTK